MATALQRIVAWAKKLPDWQSDLVRRLLTKTAFAEADLVQVLQILKKRNGLTEAGDPVPEPEPLKAADVSGAGAGASIVSLKGISHILHVNALQQDSEILFPPNGLTVVYGENAAGKSGYARVLKRACRARDTEERILPNVHSATSSGPPSATIHLVLNGESKDVPWKEGEKSSDLLSGVTVFDARCARVIIDKDNDAYYLPFGASVFGDMVAVLKEMKSRLLSEKERQAAIRPVCPEIPSDTQSGEFLSRLNRHTDFDSLREWTNEDDRQLLILQQRVLQADADDPRKSAQRLRNRAGRFKSLADSLAALEAKASIAVEQSVREALDALGSANRALKEAPKVVLAEEPLHGVGSAVWQAMYRAASDFATQLAYPGKPFPYVDEGSRCVYCQQVLTEDGKARLKRFREFMEQAVRKLVEKCEARVAEVRKILPEDDPKVLEPYKDVMDELSVRGSKAADEAPVFVSAVRSRISSLVTFITTGVPPAVSSPGTSPATEILRVASLIEDEAAKLTKAADPATLDRLRNERRSREARKALISKRSIMEKYVQQLLVEDRYDRCIAETGSKQITDQGKDIVQESLTEGLQGALDRELRNLGAGYLSPFLHLKPIGVEGETKHRLRVKSRRPTEQMKLTDILSEGEQRVVAIAGFLAELKIAGHKSAIVFDDPVSSLDHHYRQRIAERVVNEASERQVVLFTHDISFLMAIQAFGQEYGLDDLGNRITVVPVAVRAVERHGTTAGVVSEEAPWEVRKVSERIQWLRGELAIITPLYLQQTNAYNQAGVRLYDRLRRTWERLVEETLFDGVVMRHQNEVKTQSLKGVRVSLADSLAVDRGMTKSSAWLHDKAAPLDVNSPPPDEIKSEIDKLENFYKSIKKRRDIDEKEFKNVKAGRLPAGPQMGSVPSGDS